MFTRDDLRAPQLAIGPAFYVVCLGVLSVYTEFPGVGEDGGRIERVKVAGNLHLPMPANQGRPHI